MSRRYDHEKEIEKAFLRADREIEKTAAAVMRLVDRMLSRIEDPVAYDYVIEGFLLSLLRDHDALALLDRMTQPHPTKSVVKLSNALADYRDTHWKHR